MDKNNLGSFNSLQELWEAHPEGGHEGDYATVNGVVFRWNKYNRIWSGTGTPMETYGRKTDLHEGDVVINNDLTVAGMIRARGVKQPNRGLFHDLASLQKRYPFPEVGWWATVGDSVPGQIYRCDQPGVWSATGETGGLDSVDYEKINKIEQLLQEGYTFMGVATSETNPGTPDQKVFYIANGKDTYAKFGGINVDEDEVVLLIFEDVWKKLATGIASNSKLTELATEIIMLNGIKDVLRNKSIYNTNGAIKTDNGYYITPYIPVSSEDYVGFVISPSITNNYLILYDKDYGVITYYGTYADKTKITLSDYPSVAYVRMTFKEGERGSLSINGAVIWDNNKVDFSNVYTRNSDLILSWIITEAFTASNIVRDSDGNVTSLDVTWCDSEQGKITLTRDSDGNATSMTATYRGKTYVLTITRDSEGNVISTKIQ